MKYIASFIIFFNLFFNILNAQENFNNSIINEKFSISLGTFTNEVLYKKKIGNYFSSSFAFGYAKYAVNANVNLNNNNSIIKLNTDITAFKSNIEYIPKNFLNISFITGIAYNPKYNLNVEVSLKDNIKFGDIILKPDVAGNIFANVDYSGISPFAGLSHHTLIGERLSFESKLTFNYFSNPKVLEYGGTNIFNYNYQNQYQFQNLINQFKVLPSLNFGLNYLIK